MTSPVADFYGCQSGGVIAAGRFHRPAWRRAMSANTWSEIGNTLSTINPKNNPVINPNYPSNPEWSGTGDGHQMIVLAWCGACFDGDGSTLWLPLSGGHGDYAGNEPYRISLNQDAPVWEMVRPPSGSIGNLLTTNDGLDSTGVYADGRPRAIHSYNKPVYIPGIGPSLAVQGNCSWGGQSGTRDLLIIDPTTGECDRKSAVSGQIGTTSGVGACYDPLRHAVWAMGVGTAGLCRYSIGNNTWSVIAGADARSGYIGLEYLPGHDCIFIACSFYANKFAVADCTTGSIYQPSLSGSLVGMTLSGACQPRWVPELGAIALWDNSTDTATINLLTPGANASTDTWTVSQLTVAPANSVIPTEKAGNGTYGRFFYSAKLGGFGVLNATNQPLYFYALD